MTGWVGWGTKILLLKKLIIFFFSYMLVFDHFSAIVIEVFCNMKHTGDILYNLPVHFFPLWKMSELLHYKSNKMTCSPCDYLDKPGHPPNLIPVITVRMKKPWVLLATHWAHSEDSGQTGWMPSLILVFAGCTDHFACLSCFGSNGLNEYCNFQLFKYR